MENKQAETKRPRICLFCNQEDDNELLYGKIYELDDIVTHYYCLLLSSNMEQNGGDNDGILGFLREDILKELKRGKRLVCWYCKRSGATLGCCVARCKKVFHLPCGRKDGSLHQFFGQFKSFCSMHRPVQKIDASVLKEVSNKENSCTICYERVEASACSSTLWAPCCRINAWFHRDCVQRLAMSAGYFFKCPLCNNKTTFQKAMLDFGIYIPEQDASWELVPNAFQELLHRHNRCDAFKCNCPKGRGHDMGGTRWELVLCKYCGSQGIHLGCGPLRWSNPEWECDDCKDMLQNSQERGDDEEEEEEQEQVSEPVPAPSSVLQPRRRRRHRPGNYHFGPVRKSKPPAVRQTESPAPSSPEASKEGQVPSPMAAGPVSPPTPIAVVEVSDDDIIEILDDDDSNDQNVILSSDGIAIPVVQVMSIPIDNDGRDFCVEGDVNVRVPGQLNPSPSPPVPRTTPLSKAVPPPVPKLEPPVPKAASPVQRPAAPVERTAPPVLRAAPPVLRAAPPVLRAAPPVLRAAPTVQRPTLPVQRPAPQVSTRASLPAPRPTPSFPAQQDTSGPTYMSQGYPTFQNGNSAKKLKMSDSTPAMGLQPTLPYNGQAASSVVMGGSNLLKSYLSTNNPPQQQQQPQPPPPLQSFQFGMLPYTNQSLASPAAAVYPNNRGSATKQHGTSTSPRVPSSTGAAATTTTTTASTRPCNRPNRNGIVREQTHRSAAPTQRKSGHSDDRVMSSNVRLSDLQFRVVGTTKLQMVFLDQSVVTFDLRPNGLKSPCRKITNQSSYKSSGSNPARPALVSPPIVQSESVATQSQASPPAQSTDTAPVKKKKKVLNMYPSRKRKRSLSAKKSTDDNSPAAPVMRLRSVTSRASRSTSQPVPTSSKTVSEVADSAKRNRIGGSVGKLSVTPIAGKKTPRYNTRSRSEEDCLQLRRLHGRRRMFQTPVAPPVNVELPPLSKRKKPNKNVEPAPEASTSSVIPLDNDTTISEDDLISALNNDISSNMDLLDYIETRSFSDCEFVEDSCSEVTIFIDHDDRHQSLDLTGTHILYVTQLLI